MSPAPPRPLILCVDDQETNLAIRKIFLEAQGYAVMTAASGLQGLQLLRSGLVDALVLDYRMPGMDGEEVAAIVRAERPELPIIVLSGYVAEIPPGLRQQATAFVAKGSPPQLLLHALESALGVRPAAPSRPGVELIASTGEHAGRVREHLRSVREHIERVHKTALETKGLESRNKKRTA
jgi:CheY-like chemotaxis protein